MFLSLYNRDAVVSSWQNLHVMSQEAVALTLSLGGLLGDREG